MTLADLQRRIDALGMLSIAVKMPPSGGYLVTGTLRDGAAHQAWIQPGLVPDDVLLERTVDVFLRGAETRERQPRGHRTERVLSFKCPCGAVGTDSVRCASCGQERVP